MGDLNVVAGGGGGLPITLAGSIFRSSSAPSSGTVLLGGVFYRFSDPWSQCHLLGPTGSSPTPGVYLGFTGEPGESDRLIVDRRFTRAEDGTLHSATVDSYRRVVIPVRHMSNAAHLLLEAWLASREQLKYYPDSTDLSSVYEVKLVNDFSPLQQFEQGHHLNSYRFGVIELEELNS